MTDEAGWQEVGGRMIRTATSERVGDETITRTKWIPKADWWPGRPGALNEAKTRDAVIKAIAGEPLKRNEQLAIDYMVKIANERLDQVKQFGDQEWSNIAADIKAEGHEPSTQNTADADLVAKANDIDADAVERAAMQHQDDDQAFMAEVQRIVDEDQSANAPRGGQENTGSQAAKAGAEKPDPLAKEADLAAAKMGSVLMEMPDGSKQRFDAASLLQGARDHAAQMRKDAGLFETAAMCAMGKE